MTVLTEDERGPRGPAGIPNFAWVEGRWLARGSQPPLTLAAYRDLQEFGFASVLSLRAEREYPEDDRKSYDAADERSLCETLGLTFHQVPCTDFQAPGPDAVVAALSVLRGEAERGRTVYMHCFAGVGRTGVISGAWQMLRGASGTEVLRQFAHFCEESRTRRAAQRLPQDYLQAVGADYQAWVLLRIAGVLGRPVDLPVDFVRPRRPEQGRNWRRRFSGELQRHLGRTED